MMPWNVCDLRHTLQFPPGASITSSRQVLVAAYGGLHVTNTINVFAGNGPTSVGTSRTPQQSAHDTPGATSAPAPSDVGHEVRITGTASRLASLGAKLSALPAVNPARVERVSHALATGTYSMSADKIASGLLQSERALAQVYG
jgi:flagellar biosynthesis anti-sigma factor FlgM